MHALKPEDEEIVYPETGGTPVAKSTRQRELSVMLRCGIDSLIADFVAAELFWYPIHGDPNIVAAPDVMVALGRPKGHRASYYQWLEGGLPPAVVVETGSPERSFAAFVEKHRFYDRHGVQEFWAYNPDTGDSAVWIRTNGSLELAGSLHGFTSPLLGVRFEIDKDLHVYGPNGERFLTDVEQARALQSERAARRAAEKAQQDAEKAQRDAEKAQRDAEARAAALLERLRAAGLEP